MKWGYKIKINTNLVMNYIEIYFMQKINGKY